MSLLSVSVVVVMHKEEKKTIKVAIIGYFVLG